MNKKVKVVLIALLIIALMTGMFFLGQGLVNNNNKVTSKEEVEKKDEIKNSVNKKEEYAYSTEAIPVKFEKGSHYNSFSLKDKIYFTTEESEKYYLSNSSGKLITTTGFDVFEDNVIIDNELYFIVGNNEKYGVIDSKGNVVLEIKYDYIYFEETIDKDTYLLIRNNGMYAMAYINNGKLKIGKFYKDYEYGDLKANIFQECKYGYCPVIDNNNFGYIDYKGNTIVELKYPVEIDNNYVKSLREESIHNSLIEKVSNKVYFVIVKDYRLGLVDEKGKTIISPIYYSVNYSPSTNSFISIGKNTVVSINTNGKIEHDFKKQLWFDEYENFNEFIPYYDGSSYEEGFIKFFDDTDGVYYVFDNKYNLLKKYNGYNNSYNFYENFYVDTSDDNSLDTMYDYKNKKIIPNFLSLEEIEDNKNIYYNVCIKEKECYIYNKKMEKLFDKPYKEIYGIYNNLIYVSDGKSFKVLDLKGNIVTNVVGADSEKNIGFRFEELEDQNLLVLDVFPTNDEKTLMYGTAERSIYIDKNGKIKADIKEKVALHYYKSDDYLFTTLGIINSKGEKSNVAKNIDFDKYDMVRYEEDKENIYIILSTAKKEYGQYDSIVYKLEKKYK